MNLKMPAGEARNRCTKSEEVGSVSAKVSFGISRRSFFATAGLAGAAASLAPSQLFAGVDNFADAAGGADEAVANQFAVHYKTARINDLDIFYREAGSPDAPAILLLHGFPTSSNMFRNLIPRLAGSFHVIAPDYPGYGQSSMPDRKNYSYTFANVADILDKLTQQLKLNTYSLYVMDYGAPAGYRLALLHPERVQALIVQNGNAYDEGLLKFWDPIKKYWKDPAPENRAALAGLVEPKTTRWQYEHGVTDLTLLDPTTWMVDQVGLDRPGNGDIQLDMLYDYRTNVPLYPKFQEFFRQHQPPTLIVWGKNDFIFPPEGAAPYSRDLKNLETHLLDTGHFALETHGPEIANRIQTFCSKNKITHT
jgi:pimeloyl-ACP methyl ester carboxylesterase